MSITPWSFSLDPIKYAGSIPVYDTEVRCNILNATGMTVHVGYAEETGHKSIMIPTADTTAIVYKALTAVVSLEGKDFCGVVWDTKEKRTLLFAKGFGPPKLLVSGLCSTLSRSLFTDHRKKTACPWTAWESLSDVPSAFLELQPRLSCSCNI